MTRSERQIFHELIWHTYKDNIAKWYPVSRSEDIGGYTMSRNQEVAPQTLNVQYLDLGLLLFSLLIPNTQHPTLRKKGLFQLMASEVSVHDLLASLLWAISSLVPKAGGSGMGDLSSHGTWEAKRQQKLGSQCIFKDMSSETSFPFKRATHVKVPPSHSCAPGWGPGL